MMTEVMKNCIADNKADKKTPAHRPIVPKIKTMPERVKLIPKKPVRPIIKPVIPTIKDTSVPNQVPYQKDTLKQHPAVPISISPVVKPLPLKTAGRINKEIRSITVHQKKIKLSIYDNAEVDGDSVSIYYNGRLMASHIRLAEKPFILDIDLDTTRAFHSVVMFAENLGSIPPNTALLIFTDDSGKRYEVFSSATLDQNAELVFKYEPAGN